MTAYAWIATETLFFDANGKEEPRHVAVDDIVISEVDPGELHENYNSVLKFIGPVRKDINGEDVVPEVPQDISIYIGERLKRLQEEDTKINKDKRHPKNLPMASKYKFCRDGRLDKHTDLKLPDKMKGKNIGVLLDYLIDKHFEAHPEQLDSYAPFYDRGNKETAPLSELQETFGEKQNITHDDAE